MNQPDEQRAQRRQALEERAKPHLANITPKRRRDAIIREVEREVDEGSRRDIG